MELRGTVIEGQKLGRQLGVPTANISLEGPSGPAGHSAHEPGVFAAHVDGPDLHAARAMAYIGSRPTVDGGGPMLEVHVLDFDGDLYGAELTVRLLARVREEVRLDSLDALAERIRQNLALVRAHFGAA